MISNKFHKISNPYTTAINKINYNVKLVKIDNKIRTEKKASKGRLLSKKTIYSQ